VITHDFAEIYGGAERVTQEIARAFPDAPVYALLGRAEVAERMGLDGRFHSLLPPRRRLLAGYRRLSPAYPLLARAVRLPEADVLVSSSYAFAHHFRTANDAPQVCYCHSPLRFAWTMQQQYGQALGATSWKSAAFGALARYHRTVDRRMARRRVERYLTQSHFTAGQIERYYSLRAHVVGAPIDTSLFAPSGAPPSDYFLLSGRLIEPYKRVGIVIEAFNELGARLVIAGDGPARRDLEARAGRNVEFAGHLADRELVDLMQHCRAAIFPSRDDFGLVPVEVMACGRPVIAYSGGGARMTVKPPETGILFDAQTPQAVAEAVRRFDDGDYDPVRIRRHAQQWSAEQFRRRLREHVLAVAGDGQPSSSR
jgi:glycosyltransferase involved in cell wall biosynthesis